MDAAKLKLLEDTYKTVMDTCMLSILPISHIEQLVDKNVMGYGSAADEKITSAAELYQLVERQRAQSEDLDLNWKLIPQKIWCSGDGNTAFIADDILLTIASGDAPVEMALRFSSLFEYQANRWVLVHFHSSKPENVASETDTFGVADWKKKAEALEKIVADRTSEISAQKEKIEQTLHELKSTQQQLIQSEKMASLGELTAGIAHEIQNPLNFVNNFSDLSNELLDEMNEELAKGDIEEAKFIAADIKQNLEKINHHGKRADSIVKGMLQHSRSSSGVKEPTDINSLCDEYLRLSYHGLRAKDKSFNAALKTDFDESIGKINVVPQDMGRVILNLLTNAFYAVNEKKKLLKDGYDPIVGISTKKITDGGINKIAISVSDNGNGIPQQVIDKIFQPFFTTKPTGQGTGLGLSLSYEIVTKGHGGELKMDTESNKGTTFTIYLPI